MTKRLNKRLLTWLTLTVMGIALLGAILPRLLLDRDAAIAEEARNLWTAAQRATAAGTPDAPELWRETVRACRKAANRRRGDTTLLVRLGDALHELSRYDAEIGADVKVWESALEADPRCVPALQRLLPAYMDLAAMTGSAEIYQKLADRADRLRAAAGERPEVEAHTHIGVVGAWLGGAVTEQQRLERSVARLAELLADERVGPAAPNYAAIAYMRLAQDEVAAGNMEASRQWQSRAQDAFALAVTARPGNPGLSLAHCRLKRAIAELQPQGPAISDLEAIEQDLDQAALRVAPEDTIQTEITLARAESKQELGKLAEAESLLANHLSRRPWEMPVRLALSRLLASQPHRIEQAIALLTDDAPPDRTLAGYRALAGPELAAQKLILLTQLRLDQYASADASKRPPIMRQIEDGYHEICRRMSAEQPPLLRLKGQMLLLQHDAGLRVEGIKLLQRASDKLQERGQFDPDLTYRLASAYLNAGQTGQAKSLLVSLLARRPDATTVRIALARLLLSQNQLDEAVMHIERLERTSRADAAVTLLRIGLETARGRRDLAKSLAASFNEVTPQQRLQKAQAFLLMNQQADAEQLLVPLSRDELAGPSADLPAARALARLYSASGRGAEAQQLLTQALLRCPDDEEWKQIATTVTRWERPTSQPSVSPSDPVLKVIQDYREARGKRETNTAAQNLLNAAQRYPDDVRLLEALMQQALDTRDWQQAQRWVEKLAELNGDRAGGLRYRVHFWLAKGELDSALQAAQQLTRQLGEFGQSWATLGAAQAAAGEHRAAVDSYVKALERQLDNPDAIRGLINSHLMLGQPSQAKKYITQGLRLESLQSWCGEMEKQIEERYGNPASVTAARERAWRENPESVQACLALAANYERVCSLLAANGDTRQASDRRAAALTLLRDAHRKWPDDETVCRVLAGTCFRLGQSHEGLLVLQQYAQDDRCTNQPEPWLMLGKYCHMLGPAYWKKAEDAYKKATTIPTGGSLARNRLAEFYQQTEQWDAAISTLSAIAADSSDPNVHRQLVELCFKAGRNDQAQEALASLSLRMPRDARVLALQAMGKMRQGNLRAAMDLATQAIAANACEVQALCIRGALRGQMGDTDGALADLQTAQQISPSNPEIRLVLAELYSQHHQLENAAKAMEGALMAFPMRKDIRTRLFRLYCESRRWSAAETLLSDARNDAELSLDPSWFRLETEMWLQRNDPAKAVAAAERAAQIAPSDPETILTRLNALLVAGRHDQLIPLADAAAQDPNRIAWRFVVIKGKSLVAKGHADQAAQAFADAMVAAEPYVDAAIAAALISEMVQTIGPVTSAQNARHAKNRWWRIQLPVALAKAQCMDRAADAANELLAEDLDQPTPALKPAALNAAGTALALAAEAVTGAAAKAVKAYQQYLQTVAPQSSPAALQIYTLSNLAYLHTEFPETRNLTKAIEFSKRACELADAAGIIDSRILAVHGWALVQSGRLDEGIARLAASTKAGQPSPDAHCRLGEALLCKSAFDQAEQHLRRAKSLLAETQSRGESVPPRMGERIDAALERLRQARASAVSLSARS